MAAIRHNSNSNASGDRDLSIDTAARLVTIKGRDCELTRLEFDLLATLDANAGSVLTHQQLAVLVWGYDDGVDKRAIEVLMSRLRRKLARHGLPQDRIATVRGVGYRMENQNHRQPVTLTWDQDLILRAVTPRDANVLGWQAGDILHKAFVLPENRYLGRSRKEIQSILGIAASIFVGEMESRVKLINRSGQSLESNVKIRIHTWNDDWVGVSVDIPPME
jgi:DNA-binding winged helix-turn-helix (wHTH) protein